MASLPTLERLTALSSDLRRVGVDVARDVDLTPKQIAQISGLSTRTIIQLCKHGELGCIRHNRRVTTIPLEDWRAYRERRRTRAM